MRSSRCSARPARRLLDPAAFAYVDAAYLDTHARAGACAGLLRDRGTAASAIHSPRAGHR